DMANALWIGTTGLSASNKQLDVIGNNLANANTIGFKSSDAVFSSMLSQSLSGGSGATQVGQGVGVAAVVTQFAQGSFESTGNATDVAIDGSGYFIVKDKDGLTYYTRAGSFYINANGDLCDMSGYLVQGHMIGSNGKESTEMTKLNLTGRKSKPHETTEFRLGLNLDVETDPLEASNYFNATQTIYDSAGRKHSFSTRFQHGVETENLWLVSAKVDDGPYVFPSENAWIEFDTTGELITSTRRQILAGNIFYSDDKAKEPVTSLTTFGTFYNASGTSYDCSAGKTIRYYGVKNDGTAVGDANTPYTYTIGTNTTLSDFLKDVVAKFGGADTVEANIVEGRIVLIDKTTGKSNLSFTICPKGADPTKNSTADVAIFGDIVTTNLLGQIGATDLVTENKFFDFSTQNTSIGKKGVITWDLTSQNRPEITSYALDSRVNYISNDGFPAGLLSSLDVSKNGIIQGFFTNGQQQQLARILIASFTNNNGLNKVGSYFTETSESGTPSIGNPSEGGLGGLQSHSLEISNTDVAKEFIKMIAAQRAYQSSSRIITAADEMLQELMNIKR
ncbi:MAG: flagellar hook-basal body complex protein, partial [Syntrophales bacterium]|nr:flagellar hook-basal body complex protein [Syntrophales bacterium]